MIDRIYVHNYRCLENFSLDLAGRSSALLIGRNGAGKSTILECLRLFQNICRGSNRVGERISKSDFTRNRTEDPIRFEVELTLAKRRFKYALSFEWLPNGNEARVLDESLAVDGIDIFTRHHKRIQLAGGYSFGLDWSTVALPVIEESHEGRAIQDIKAFFASMILISPIPSTMTGFAEEPSLQLFHDAANYASCLRGLFGKKPASYNEFDTYVKSVLPDFSTVENIERGESGTQLFVEFEQMNPKRNLRIEFKSLSDGEKCFFLCAYIIAFNQVGSGVFCMWDEPDNHLALSEVGQFITGLRKMNHRGGQFLATSHHPETIRKFSDETTFVLTRQSHLDPTVIRPLSELAYAGDLINALIRDEIIG